MNRPQVVVLFLALAALCGGAILFWPEGAPPIPNDGSQEVESSANEQEPGESDAPATPAAPLPDVEENPTDGQRVEDLTSTADPVGSTALVHLVDQNGDSVAGVVAQVIEAWDQGSMRGWMRPQERLVYDPELELARAESDASGTIRLKGLPSQDKLSLFLSKDGLAGVEIDFETGRSDETVELGPVTLRDGLMVEIELVDTDGAPVVGEFLDVGYYRHGEEGKSNDDPHPPIQLQTAETDAQGLARFPNLPLESPESLSFSGFILGPDSKFEELEGSTETHQRVRITVPALEWVEGRVVDTNGTPVAGAMLSVRRGDPWLAQTDEGVTPEDLLGKNAGVPWTSHSTIEHFESEHLSDADGKFRADLPREDRFNTDESGMTDLVAATAMLGPDLVVAGNWFRNGETLELVVPVMHQVQGRVVDSTGAAVPGSEVVFYAREEAEDGDYEVESQNRGFDRMHWPRGVPCDDSGRFTRLIEEGRYWAAVTVPGGRYRFEGPFDITTSTEFPELVIQPGPELTLELQSPDPGQKFGEVRARRVERPQEEEEADAGSLFGGGREREPNTPWGSYDSSWRHPRYGDGAVEGQRVTWRNQPEGDWRYTVQVDGFIPVLVDREIGPAFENETVSVELEPLGGTKIRVLQRTGEPATGVTILVFPVEGEGKNPVHAQLDETPGIYHREGRSVVPNEDGIAHFPDLIPDTYEIYSIEGEERNGYASRYRVKTPPLDRVTVTSGELTETEVTLASLAELRLTVTSRGELVAGAQVLAMPVQDSIQTRPFGLVGLGNDQDRFTDANGSHLIPALAPGQTYRVGARVPAKTGKWQDKTAWTVVEWTPEVGTSELTIELETASVAFELAGNPDLGDFEFCLLSMEAIPSLPASADEEMASMHDRIDHIDRTRPWSMQRLRRARAEGVAQLGNRVELDHLTPGKYRLHVVQKENYRTVLSEHLTTEFTLAKDESLDLGVLELKAWTSIVLNLDCSSIPKDKRWKYDIGCRLVGETRLSAEIDLRFDAGESVELKSRLAPGEYVFVLIADFQELGQSEPFTVVDGQETLVNWTTPTVPQLDGD